MAQVKQKKVIFRIESGLKDFLEKFSKDHGITPSETCRNILTYFMMGYLMGEFTKSQSWLEERFAKKFSNKKARKEFMKKYKPEKLKKTLNV